MPLGMTGSSSWASLEERFGRLFRTLTWVAFIPALPMLITHGVLSRDAVPAVGLVPLAISTVAGITLLRHKNKLQAQSADGHEGGAAAAGHSEIGAVESGIAELDSFGDKITHPLAVFAFDIAIAASIMVVLVYTWKSSSTSASLSMLAAYATIPLMLSL